MSADGNFVAFLSQSTNLVPGDTNNKGDVFLRDLRHPIAPTVTITAPTSGASLQVGDTALAAYSCADVSGYGLTSCVGTVPNGAAINTSTAGVKSFSVAATEAAGLSTIRTVSYTVFDKIVAQTFGVGGGVVTTDPGGGPTPAEPVETTVASPNSGLVTLASGVATTPTPSGFALLTKQVNIAAPPASAAAPLLFTFDVDASLLPPGETKDTLSVLKDGASLFDCIGTTTLPLGFTACAPGVTTHPRAAVTSASP